MTLCQPLEHHDARIPPLPWPELDPALSLVSPRHTLPVVFASPHSGRCYPAAFRAASHLPFKTLRTSEDAWVDRLFGAAPKHGAHLLCARFPRAMLDANRDPLELDPAMFENVPAQVQTRQSPRVSAGLGVIARLVAVNTPIYPGALAWREAVLRLQHLHAPYHHALGALLQSCRSQFGAAFLVDCHSMPSGTVGQADFVLGDAHGRSCQRALTAHVERTLTGMGYKVVRNTPYAGGYATMHYGDASKGMNALQIEIRRSLYMDEARLEKNSGFAPLRRRMSALAASICHFAENAHPGPEKNRANAGAAKVV